MKLNRLLHQKDCEKKYSGRTALAEHLLHKKYGVPFTITAQRQKIFFSLNEYEVLACPDYDKSLTFTAEINGEGNYLHDNFIRRKISRDVEKKIRENLLPSLGKCDIRVSAGNGGSSSSNPNLSVESFLMLEKPPYFIVEIFVLSDILKRISSDRFYPCLFTAFNGLPKLSGSIMILLSAPEIKDEYNPLTPEPKHIYLDFEANRIAMPFTEFSRSYVTELGGKA